MNLSRLILSSCALLVGASIGAAEWQALFNGRDLEGWEQRNGEARFFVEEGAIVGEARSGTPNSFLCTRAEYGNFILEFEVKVDVPLNSGVQVRSHSRPDYRDGRVHGYQVEIDPSPRGWSGGIYDEARRGWIYPLTRNERSRRAFRNGAWNRVRVEAIGNSIRTWVNGVQCADLADDMTPSGFIALQVHSIRDAEHEGLLTRWRDIRILTEDLSAHRQPLDPDVPEISWLKNELTEREQRHGWRLLWDGETADGWRSANGTGFPERGWQIEDGTLTVLESGGGESRNGGDIVTEQEFANFELELDFRITEGANSGIKYFVVEGINEGPGSAIGLEFQILDDERHPDAKKGVAGNRTVGGLYDLIRPGNLSESNRSAKRVNPPGSWNKARLLVRGNHVEHWLNNIKVVEYERGSQVYRNLVAKSKYDRYEGFGEALRGHLLLQDHGNHVSFRSIKIREF